MDSHSRSASPRERPLHRPPSPPDSPTAFDNQGFQHEEDPNHNESFTSSASQTNGTNGHVKSEVKTLEAVNLELINMTPKKKEVDTDTTTNPYDEYFVPVNEHRKYMRGEKLYVTADKRSDKGGCKRSLCWTLLGLVAVAIVVLIVLAATGLLFANTPTTLEQYNSSISSARALGGIGIPQHNVEFTQPEQHKHDHSEHDHSQHENSIDHPSQYYPRNNMPGSTQNQGSETDFPSTSPDLGDNPPMYVPQTVEGEIKIDSEEFSEVLQDPENDSYKEFATDFTAALRSALFSRNTLNNDSLQINVQVVQIRRGSIIVTYRVHWNSKANQYEMRDFLTPTKLKNLLNSYLDKNNRMISIYHIAEDKISTRLVLDNCQINKNDCEYGCKFDESTLDFICTCPPSYILDMENQKKCVHILENADDSEKKIKEFRVLAIDNSSKAATSDMDGVLNLKTTTEASTEITTEADMDLFLSHIMSDHKNQSEKSEHVAVAEPTPEPVQEPTPEPAQEPETEHYSVDIAPAQEPIPEPTQEPTPEPVQEPTPEPAQEPTPEPTQEPTPKPAQEPTPEPAQEPTPEPVQEPTPEPAQEPTPEPAQEPTPEPAQEPTPEPVQEPTPEPAQEPTPEPAQEPTPEPSQEPTEPAQEPTPEPSQEPTEPAQEKISAVTQKQTIMLEPTADPAQESTPEHSQILLIDTASKSTPEPKQDAKTNETNQKSLFSQEPYLTTDIPTTDHLTQLSPITDSNIILPVHIASSTPITTTGINLASNTQPTSETAIESKSVLPLTTAPTPESESLSTETEPSIKIVTISPITEVASEPINNIKEQSLDSKTKQPKQLKPISMEKIVAKENNESSTDSSRIDNSLNDQNTTPDTMVDLDMEFKTLLGTSASENDVPQNTDYLSNTKTDNLPNDEESYENDEKINNISLDDLNKMLTKTTTEPTLTTTQQKYATISTDNSHSTINTMNNRRNSFHLTELTTNNDIETTTISEWIQYSSKENKLTTNSEKSIYSIFDNNDNSTEIDKLKHHSTMTSTEGSPSVTKTNDRDFSMSLLTTEQNIDRKEDNETSLISNYSNMYNLTKLVLKDQELVTLNPISNEKSGELYNTIQSQEDPTTLIPNKKPYENKTLNQIQITFEGQKEEIPKSVETTTIFKSKIETENEKAKKANQLDIILNDKLKKQKALYKSKLDNIPLYSNDDQTTTDSDWLTESVIEIKYDYKMNARDQPNNSERENLSKTEDINDFEHYYKLSSGSMPNLKKNDGSLYSLIDYDTPDTPAKREYVNSISEVNPTINTFISNEIPNNSKPNQTEVQSSSESTTVVEYIYKSTENLTKDVDLHNTTPMMNAEEPAPVWELHEPETNSSTYINIKTGNFSLSETTPHPQMLQDVKIADMNPPQSNIQFDNNSVTSMPLLPSTLLNAQENTDSSLDLGNVTHLNNLNVTIYEISNQNIPTTKSPISQTLEYEDNESEMNPFLPEVENNKSLVKKLQEGHDIEPINVNETQNENLDEGHNLPIYNSTTNKSSEIPKRHAASNDDLNNDLNNTESGMNNYKTIELSSPAETNPSDHAAVPVFLKDTEDLDTNQVPVTSSVSSISDDISRTEESSTSLSELITIATDNNDLNVVPLEKKSEQNILETEVKAQNNDSTSVASENSKEDSETTNVA